MNCGELARGRTTFIIAHRFSTIRIADRILVFDGGRMVGDGTFAELEAWPSAVPVVAQAAAGLRGRLKG